MQAHIEVQFITVTITTTCLLPEGKCGAQGIHHIERIRSFAGQTTYEVSVGLLYIFEMLTTLSRLADEYADQCLYLESDFSDIQPSEL